MIPKVHDRSPIRHLGCLLRYLFGPGENNERGGRHDNPHVIAAWAYATAGNLAELQPPITPHGRLSVRWLTELLEQPARICGNLQPLPVWHCSVHNHPDDPILTDQQWEHIATEITAAVGLAPHGDLDATRWIGVRHADNHIHIVATLARQDRHAVWLWQDYRRAQACCRKLEQHHGLHRVEGRRDTPRYATAAELKKSAACKPNSSKPASHSTSSAPNSTSLARTSEPRRTTSTRPSPAPSTRSPTSTAS